MKNESDKNDTLKNRMLCQEIMSGNLVTTSRETNLREVSVLMSDRDMGALPVTDSEGKLVGILTDRDIVVRAVAQSKDIEKTTVGDIMTKKIFTLKPDDLVFTAIRLMGEEKIRRIPIVDNEGKLQGIVSIADIALEIEDEREIAEALEEISSGKAFWSK